MTIAADARERARQTTGQFGTQEHSAPEMNLDARAKTERTRELARDLLYQHGLADWRVRIDNAQERLGLCDYATKTVSLSRQYIAVASDAQALDTILHEIAHAHAGSEAGHGPEWKAAAERIGANPSRTADVPEMKDAKSRRLEDAIKARPFRRGAHIPDGTVVVIADGQYYLRGMRAMVLSKAHTRYLVETEDGQRFKSRSEMLAPVPA